MTPREEEKGWKKRLKELGLARRRGKKPLPAPRSAASAAGATRSGRDGEETAARFLLERGIGVLFRNVRYPDGELDLVAEESGTLLFVEVKRRRSPACGIPAEAVTPRKRGRVLVAARRWLAENPVARSRQVRFDVVAIQDEPFQIEWIRGAFDAS